MARVQGTAAHLLENAERGTHSAHDLPLPPAGATRAGGGARLAAAALARVALLQVVDLDICGGSEHCVEEVHLQAVGAVFARRGPVALLLPAVVRSISSDGVQYSAFPSLLNIYRLNDDLYVNGYGRMIGTSEYVPRTVAIAFLLDIYIGWVIFR